MMTPLDAARIRLVLEDVPELAVDRLYDPATGRCCVVGQLYRALDILPNDHGATGIGAFHFALLQRVFGLDDFDRADLIAVNDNRHHLYRQGTAKARVLAYLQDCEYGLLPTAPRLRAPEPVNAI